MEASRGRLAIPLLIALLALVGCASAGSSGGAVAADGAEAAPSMASDADAPMDPLDPTSRQVIVTATATVIVADPATAADDMAALAEAAGGRVEGREEYAGGGAGDTGSATLILRVPSEELSGVIDDLDGLGEVESITQSQDDVTGTVQDLDARIAALETSTQRLLEIMATADDTTALLAAETQLSDRQADLEALQTQRDTLTDQVALSTLTVSFYGEPVPVAESRGGFLGGLESGWNALVAFLSTALVVIGALLPWVLALGIPTVAIVALVRRRNRNRARPDPTGPPRPGNPGPPGGWPGHGGPGASVGQQAQHEQSAPQST